MYLVNRLGYVISFPLVRRKEEEEPPRNNLNTCGCSGQESIELNIKSNGNSSSKSQYMYTK